jgi:predicted dehydrogenase
VLLNQCPHQLDLWQWLFGMPSRMRAFCRLGKWHDIEVEDDVTAYMEYSGGATGVFIASTGEHPGTNRLEVAAERGRVVVEGGKITFTRNETPVSEYSRTTKEMWGKPAVWNIDIPASGEASQHVGIIQNFVNAILDGEALIAPGEEGVNSVELANAMLYSSMKGETVEMPLDAGAYEKMLKGLIEKMGGTRG